MILKLFVLGNGSEPQLFVNHILPVIQADIFSILCKLHRSIREA